MRKTIYLIHSAIGIALLSLTVILLFAFSSSFAYADNNEIQSNEIGILDSEDSTQDVKRVDVDVTGDGIEGSKTYYLEWLGLQSIEYDGEKHIPSASLKCYEDVNVEIVMDVTVFDENMKEVINCQDVGKYTAVANLDGITFEEEGQNKANYEILPNERQVYWKSDKYIYNDRRQGPTACFVDIKGKEISLDVDGLGTNARTTHIAKIAENSIVENKNYKLLNITCSYTILPYSVDIDWGNLESHIFTYNGEEQSPTASFKDIKGKEISLDVTEKRKDVGEYTARVTIDIDKYKNYEFKNTTCSYTISPCEKEISWKSDGSYTYSGYAQGPTASFLNIENKVTPLTVIGCGIDAGEYTASIVLDTKTNNYKFTSMTYPYTILPYSVEIDWGNLESHTFTYNGEEQGPSASFTDINDNKVMLAVSGLQKEVGEYEARVNFDQEKHKNYDFKNNLTCRYSIGKLVGKVLWVAAGYYVENGETQSPRAFAVGNNGEIVELSVKSSGIEAGEYVAEIDMLNVNSKFDLTGELSFKYIILPQKKASSGGTTAAVILSVILVAVGIAALYFILLRTKEIEKVKSDRDVKEDCIYVLKRRQQETAEKVSRLELEKQSLEVEKTELNQNLESIESYVITIKKQLDDATLRLKNSKQKSKLNTIEKKQLAELEQQVKTLLEENEKLRMNKTDAPGYFRRPIEDYFPEIDNAFIRAESSEYDESNPALSYAAQKQELDTIKRLIAIYRSQRR